MLRALAIVFAVIAVGCMIFAIAGMATGRQSARTGWLVRTVALLCFGAAVGLSVAAH
jgi:predicted membrane protein